MVRLLLLIISTLIIYHRTCSYGYLIDDIEVASHPQPKEWWKKLWHQTMGHSYFNATTEHTITLLIHTVNVCLVYLAFGANTVSFVGAMLFALNPVNTQASVWLSGKVYALGATAILLGILFKPLFPVLYFLGYYLSLNAFLTPLLFIFLGPIWFAGLPILLTLVFKKRIVGEPKRRFDGSTKWMQEISFRKLIISIKTFGYYFRMCIFPTKLGMCHQYLHVFGLSKQETEKWYTLDKYFWLGTSVLGLAVTSLIMKWNLFGLYWFCILMPQWCNFIVLNHPICERYAYLANIGLMLLVSSTLLAVPYGTYILVVLGTYYATRLWAFLPAYKTNKDFFSSNIDNFDQVAIGWNQKGLELIRFGRPGDALDTFMEGLMYRPQDFRINYNSANLLNGMGRCNEAVQFVKKAEAALDPNNNYQLWRTNIDAMKASMRTRGVQIE
jgi:hypothetical protein